ncbi:hypothetical protein DVS28_a0814 [Euzebya pacifica]|uniref:Uncharacterized protein n=1 Tax=Euzebya pacifica TaxID=1608957 RepID=A0A346XTG8_9ACTN|nr:hypothetical protein DVS28_a0814 [Euzebya pacifica]
MGAEKVLALELHEVHVYSSRESCQSEGAASRGRRAARSRTALTDPNRPAGRENSPRGPADLNRGG